VGQTTGVTTGFGVVVVRPWFAFQWVLDLWGRWPFQWIGVAAGLATGTGVLARTGVGAATLVNWARAEPQGIPTAKTTPITHLHGCFFIDILRKVRLASMIGQSPSFDNPTASASVHRGPPKKAIKMSGSFRS